jgi:arylsulfatase A-like enzyme
MLVTELVLRESLGQGPGTDLLLISFSATDFVGHRYGLEGPEMTAQLKALDQIVGRVMDQLNAASHQNMVLALSSDHGAIPAPEDASGQRLGVRRVSSDVLGSALESAFQKRWPSPKDKWILSDATPYLTMNRVLAAKRGLEWHDFLRETAAIVSHVDGVGQVYLTSEIPEMGPKVPFVTTVKRSLRLDRAGDLIVILNENVLMYDKPTGTGHGTPWSYDALVPLVFWGKGIPAERFETPASPMDIAPTLGRLLGINYPAADGGALRNEIFK